jgi:alpha-L-fucosidase 2
MRLLALAPCLMAVTLAAGQAATYRPQPLQLEAPIQTWDEGLPIGNGLMGALLWGGEGKLNISLDRGDLWDLRAAPGTRTKDWTYQTMQRLVKEGKADELVRLFDAPYDNVPYPTKIPAGRIEVEIGANSVGQFSLHMDRGTAEASGQNGSLTTLVAANRPVVMIQCSIPGAKLKLVRPESLKKLGYSLAPVEVVGEDTYFVQEGALGFKYAIYVGKGKSGWAASIVTNEDAKDPLSEAKRRVTTALADGFSRLKSENSRWWDKFWKVSSVQIPDGTAQRQYDFVKYLYGAGSRPGAPPIPLQGVWTADAGNLPPWKGDYHNDLNTQMTYVAYQAAGLFDAGRSFLDFNWNLRGQYRTYARQFFGVKGLLVPGVMTLKGEPMGGWGMYSLTPTNTAWIAHLFARHWRYTQDATFLKDRAYPWCFEVGQALEGLLKPGADGYLVLPLSSSPEIHDNSLSAWLMPNSNYDQMLMADLFESLAEMAHALGKSTEAARWTQLRSRLAPFLVDPKTNSFMFAKAEPYTESHRHFSHLIGIYPLGRIRGQAATDSIRLLDKVGTDWWCGYSFSWMAAMCARNGLTDLAGQYFDDYVDAFVLRNGFHANGDQKKRGFSKFTYRPVTLEGNFLAMEALHEMLLQSWNGVIRVFPAIRDSWRDAKFDGLWTEGGYRVWAERRQGRTISVKVLAKVESTVSVADPFSGKGKWSKAATSLTGPLLFNLKPGESVVGTLRSNDR